MINTDVIAWSVGRGCDLISWSDDVEEEYWDAVPWLYEVVNLHLNVTVYGVIV